MPVHTEIHFENDICDHLSAHGWLYAPGDAANYDAALALYPDDLIEWTKATQPEAWETLVKNHGASATTGAGATLAKRVRETLDRVGTLDVLRHGVELLGLRAKLQTAQFKPALAINPDLQARYAANRLRVVRQVRYSLASGNSIDLVLFLNGIPIATAELKTDFTQNIEDAIQQYKLDRDPKPKGKPPEPLLGFPSGALVHFAVSNRDVAMTTKLAGVATRFLPFNRGRDGGAGNPPNPTGHATAYLWEEVWQRNSLLDILGRYMVNVRDEKKTLQAVLFPRYHQLDATRKLTAAVLTDGPGNKYLIQHSAGSGKTNSIAWSAHFLGDLHDANNKKMFDSVLVVSDRTVIDKQLQDAIFGFERTTGVVATIKGEEASKSGELAAALSGNKKIVVCTIQTFPFALKEVRELAATQGKRFAVIADEAHSSQTGGAASKLKAVLSAEELAEIADGGEVSNEDVMAAEMSNRANDGIAFVAFTATPKDKTMQLFGTQPDPARKIASDNIPTSFHVYSMRQAIEEGFILDVLQNYTSYKLAFRLAHNGREMDEAEVERDAAMKAVMGWVRMHEYTIAEKVRTVVEHYRQFVAPLLGGQAKAMVVVGSRLEAVRWQLELQRLIQDRGYPIKSLVAFSGDVNDKDSGPEPFNENSLQLNPELRGRDIRRAFATADYQILLVANKFQTGFDQPLLCGMYVDKKLADIQAVQTLSRLNRAHPGKDTTYVLDFVNVPADVLTAFKKYHATAELADVTDPYLVNNLREKLDSQGHYYDHDVQRVVDAELRPGVSQKELAAAVAPVEDRILKKYKAAQQRYRAAKDRNDAAAAQDIKAAKDEMNALILFKADMGSFVRLYTFLSQIHDYANTDLEKRSIFYRRLIPVLEFGREREGIDLSKVVLTHHTLRNRGKQPMDLGEGDSPKLTPTREVGSGQVREKEKALLNEIIRKVNDLFQGDVTDGDKLVYVNDVIKGKLLESKTLQRQALNNTKERFAASPDLASEILHAIMGAFDAHTAMSTQA